MFFFFAVAFNHFILKVVSPNGWSFKPSSFPINIDRETDKCSQGKDINFLFQGFSVNGKVVFKYLSLNYPDTEFNL